MKLQQQNYHTLLQARFGFKNFRPGQLEAIQILLEGNRLLCIQPTGHGKSLLYQLPALLLDGITIVISPLLALMRDQIQQLNNRFNISAATINSDQSDEENQAARQQAASGHLKILFIAPEQLDKLDNFHYMLKLPISLIVVDEAHCISTWGHDFRPSYRQIMQLVHAATKQNPTIKILGLTATANLQTQQDIQQQLTTPNHPLLVRRESMDRPNIQLSCITVNGIAGKLAIIEQLLPQLPGQGLIYCATRENTELVAEYLQKQHVKAIAYHAGLATEVKIQRQQALTHGQYKIITATNALGMGIDKSDLRFIIHFDIPGSITAYYQEVGRCGRDGQKAYGILLFDPNDAKIQSHFIQSAQPKLDDFNHIIDVIRTHPSPLRLTDIKRLVGLHPTLVTVMLAELVEQSHCEKISQGKSQVYKLTNNATPLDLSRYHNQYRVKTQELERMLAYGHQQTQCRMHLLREALGDDQATSCGHCDVCKSHSQFNITTLQTKSIDQWLTYRLKRIAPASKTKIATGAALMDSTVRTPLFIQFMKDRAHTLTIDATLIELLETHLTTLKKEFKFGCVIPIPSRTWHLRAEYATHLAKFLKIPLFKNFLYWRELPHARQGELLNNDQRRYNVAKKMTAHFQQQLPQGDILLFDDYTGSGATIKEAASVLRMNTNDSNQIVPLVIASVKWRLGQSGML